MTSKPPFALIAGIEISQGVVTLLDHGHPDGKHTYGDPVAAARQWVNQGAQWIHIADLDAAAGTGNNSEVIRHVITEINGRALVELSGAIRDEAAVKAALAARANRVVLDAAALVDRDWVANAIATHGDKLVIGLVVHDGRVQAVGTDLDGAFVEDVVHQFNEIGARSWLVYDVDAKGMRKGRDRKVIELVCERAHGEVLVFGGIERLGDLHALTEMSGHGVVGAVIDKGLYDQSFTFAEAVVAVEPRFDMFFWGPAQA